MTNGINLIKEYIKQEKEIIIFCGAGLSVNIGLPKWKDLAKSILIKISDDYGIENLKVMIPPLEQEVMPILDILELVAEKRYKTSVIDVIKDNTIIKSKDLSLHQLIYKLSKKIVTTNYDLAFEKATDNEIKTITYKDTYDLAHLSTVENYLFKIHGDIKKPETCLIFKKDYEIAYEQDVNSYFIEMAKLFTDKVFLFVGFSLSDPYVLKMFDKIHEIYQGYTSKHFIITPDNSLFDKYREYLVPLVIDSYAQLPTIIQDLNDYKDSCVIKATPINELSKHSDYVSVQICIPKPINKINDFNSEVIAASFSGYNLKLIETYFNVENFDNSYDADYIFIFSQFIKGQIVIEDEDLKFKLIKITDLNQFSHNTLKGVFLFVTTNEEEINFTKEYPEVSIPIVIIPVGKKLKELLWSIIYKAFIKSDKILLNQSYEIINHTELILLRLKKGNFQRQKQNTFISKFIDKKNLSKFVGRKSDQENIVRKILSMRYENKILSIKGSGGIGKTSIVSKLGIELAERGYFEKGIFFVTCNPIQSFENFEFEISQCFSLTSSKFLREQIIETVYLKDRIIILDNFETLLNIDDCEKVLDLVSFICDHSIVVVTTRQILDLDFEEIYELRNLTTDEAVELFKSIYSSPIKEDQEKIIRREIVEKLLNNNPLAIKLIVKGLPASKDLISLKKELEKNIFNKEDIEDIFESHEDYNIERSTSLYHSFNYSYINLNNAEKLAFELLSLFPDGMHMENFKSFCKASKNKENSIGDREIKALDNKSLLENSNGFLKLQSIISRFSDYKFKTRDQSTRVEYYGMAYKYNKFFIDLLSTNRELKNYVGLKIMDLNTNNYLKCLEYLDLVEIPSEEKIEFISKVSNIFRDTNQPNEFLKFLNNNTLNIDDNDKVLPLIIQHIIYWTKDFDDAFKYIKANYSFEKLAKLNPLNLLQKIIFNRVSVMYTTAGFDFNILKIHIENNLHENNTSHLFFKLGYLQEANLLVPTLHSDKTYFDYEIELVNGQSNLVEVERCMQMLYKKESLEMAQMTYFKSKLVSISNDEVKKLVISNPYSKGLVNLMYAKNEERTNKKVEYYEKAKKDLYHVKYHYVECIIEMLIYLKKENINENFSSNWQEAMQISKKNHFRYHIFQLEMLNNTSKNTIYHSKNYSIPFNYNDIKVYIQDHISQNKSYFKNRSLKIAKNISALSEDFS